MWTWESTDSDDPSGQRYRYREGTTLFGPVSEHTYLTLRAKEPWKWKPLSRVRLFKPCGLYSPWNFPGQNTGVSSLSLLQGIFPTQRLNPGFPHCRQILSPAEPQGKPKNTGVGSRSILQRVFQTQELNQGLLHCRWIIYQLRYWGSPKRTISSKKKRLPSEYIQLSSVQSLSCVWLFETPCTAACQASLSITNSRSLPKLKSIESVKQSNHLTLCHPLLLLPSIFPSIGIFFNESVVHIRWPKYWNFSFSISPYNEYSRLMGLEHSVHPLGRTGGVTLQSKGFSRVFSNTTVQKHQFFGAQHSL